MANNRWREDLPDSCPPQDAFEPINLVCFRLVESYPPTEIDFYSTQKRSPDRKNLDECISRACSVFLDYDACDKVRKTTFKTKNLIIVKLVLPAESGLLLRTFNKNHYSWWISKDFNPLTCCEEA